MLASHGPAVVTPQTNPANIKNSRTKEMYAASQEPIDSLLASELLEDLQQGDKVR